MEERTFRNHVSWVMFLFSILVIWAHSYNAELFSGGFSGPPWDFVSRIQSFFSNEISLTAVPGFFMLSAYLFFRNFTWEKLPGKWKGRFYSVIVPYTAWNVLYYLGYVLAARIPAVQQIVGKDPVPFGVGELMAAVLRYRYAPIFWYLYQLILLILLSPILYGILKNRTAGIIWLAALIAAVHFHLDTRHPNTDALFYYSFAAYMAIHGRRWAEAAYGKRRVGIGAVCMVMAAVSLIQLEKPGADVLWIVMYRFFVPLFVWLCFDSRYTGETRPWMRQSMFLYALHFIVVRFFNKASALILGKFLSETAMAAASMVIYLILPAVVVAVSYAAALILERSAPCAWRILSGGRSLGKPEEKQERLDG